MIPQQQPMNAAPQQQAPAPTQPASSGLPEGANGAQRVSDTQFNQGIQNVIFSRIEEEASKNPNFGQAIEKGLSPEAAMEIGLVLPEVLPLFRAVGLVPNAPDGTGIRQPSPPAQASMPQQQGNPLMEDNDEDEMQMRGGASMGLMG